MVVQVTNTGGDLGNNHFDLQMVCRLPTLYSFDAYQANLLQPGGGVGLFNGCTTQFGAPPNGWGQQYGGISQRSECDAFPTQLQAGCRWRFDWFKNADNPSVTFRPIACPAALTDKTGCKRN